MFYLVFDFTIFFILFFTAYWMYLIIHSFFYPRLAVAPRAKAGRAKPATRNTKIVRISLLTVLSITFCTIFYGSFIEPDRITVKDYGINIGKTPEHENIRIAFLSDFHAGLYKQTDYIERVVAKTLELKPDYIILGGDYIMGKEVWSYYLRPLERFKKDYEGRIFAVTGNHEFNTSYAREDFTDKTATIRKMFADYGIKILDNQSVLIRDNGLEFYFCGIKDVWTEQADLNATYEQMENKNLPKILISHNPDIILDEDSKKFDFIISGHTHGGQIRLPFIGSVPPIPDELGRAYDEGYFKLEKNQLYISSGLGESGPRARLFNPPELTIINLDL
jgi:predicted MPP superfamily phosphohydrolase